MIKFVFLDLDDTILDFHKAERIALSKTLRAFGAEPEEHLLHRYHLINNAHWEMLERGELTRQQVLVGRFDVLFRELGRPQDPAAIARCYEENLGIGHYFLPGALEAVKSLKEKYHLYLASNGTASVQRSRLTSAGLYPYFDDIFISQEMGADKPSRAYFDRCFERIPDFRPDQAVMVGDSLTSDMAGGRNAGLRTIWVNPDHLGCPDPGPDYEIESITQLEALLETL